MSLDTATVLATLPRNEREEIRIGVSEYKGRKRLDIRVWYRAGDEYRPGKQGVSLPVEQIPALLEVLNGSRHAFDRGERVP